MKAPRAHRPPQGPGHYDKRQGARPRAIPITFPPLHHVAAAVALAALSATGAQAQGVVNALCSTDAPWCEAAAKEFTRKTGIKVNQAHKGTGEIAAQLRAEAKNLFKIVSGSHKYLAGMGC